MLSFAFGIIKQKMSNRGGIRAGSGAKTKEEGEKVEAITFYLKKNIVAKHGGKQAVKTIAKHYFTNL